MVPNGMIMNDRTESGAASLLTFKVPLNLLCGAHLEKSDVDYQRIPAEAYRHHGGLGAKRLHLEQASNQYHRLSARAVCNPRKLAGIDTVGMESTI